ncbi:MAG: hypothetical protein COT15_05275 [Candidatus Diapherotrites archaeon CG08_land_8_20_14_0_20_34_12]|nr:MAG: hypothetical protein COT15_05275 [Candidatus Diapherotrites archaeon CG08_land_8_20_14_0_20_34_12]
MGIKIASGPWDLIFNGKYQGHNIEIYSNPRETLLSVIYEEDKGKRIGAILELFKVYYAQGNVEGFIDTFPKKILGIDLRADNKSSKFIFVGSDIAYSSLEESEIGEKGNEIIKRLDDLCDAMRNFSKAYDVELLELKECQDEVKQSFYSNPLVNLLVLPVSSEKPKWQQKTEMQDYGELILGLTKEGNLVKEPLSLFNRTLIDGNDKKQRLFAARVLIESSLLSRVPAMVFSFGNEFSGLNYPSFEAKTIKEYKLDLEAMGFPMKELVANSGLKTELSKLDGKATVELLGLGENNVSKAIATLINDSDSASIKQALNTAKRDLEKIGQYDKNKAIRILSLFDLRYPDIFDKLMDIPELAKISGKIARANILSCKGLGKRETLMFINSTLTSLIEYYGESKGQKINAMVVLPNAENILPADIDNKMIKAIKEQLLSLESKGILMVLETEASANLDSELNEAINSRITLVNGNDAGIQVKGRRDYRVKIRPPLSRTE